VVATNVGAVGLIIENNKNGCVVESNNVDLFYKALVVLIENENLRKTFGEALFETVQKDYSARAVVNNYINWMQKL
jgi:glycosyltransferase involved in cell wall biosynthesis